MTGITLKLLEKNMTFGELMRIPESDDWVQLFFTLTLIKEI